MDGVQLARLRVDIKDFQPAGLLGLENGAAPWVCIGKHLCGAATDFTLRCCASSLYALGGSHPSHSSCQCEDTCSLKMPADTCQDTSSDQANKHSGSSECDSPVQSAAPGSCAGNGPPGRGDSSAQPASEDSGSAASAVHDGGLRSDHRGIQGLAVATCCHHRCSWQHYAGKATFTKMGFSPEDFELISWMTGQPIATATLCSLHCP